MNVAHAITVAELLDKTGWDACDPRSGPRQLATWLAVLLAAATGEVVENVLLEVFALPIPTLLETLSTP